MLSCSVNTVRCQPWFWESTANAGTERRREKQLVDHIVAAHSESIKPVAKLLPGCFLRVLQVMRCTAYRLTAFPSAEYLTTAFFRLSPSADPVLAHLSIVLPLCGHCVYRATASI